MNQPPPKAHLLIIDDSDAERHATAEYLERSGYAISEARSAKEALALLDTDPLPDLILLDLMMPGMSGWEFRIVQRKTPRMADIPVVAVTGETNAMARAIDAAGIVQKPIQGEKLLAVVEAVLRTQEAERATQSGQFQVLGRIGATVVDELNNPLGYARSYLQLAQRELELHPWPDAEAEGPIARIQKALEMVSDGLERSEHSLKDLLLFGRTREPTLREVELETPMRLALKITAGRLFGTQVVEDFATAPRVRADASRLSQVFVNLLLNAADALDERPTDTRTLHISAEAVPEGVLVSVRDTGPGIPSHIMGRLFQPFFTTKPPGLGTGLGLFVSRGLVESWGGRLDVESEPGEGTTVKVLLPAGD